MVVEKNWKYCPNCKNVLNKETVEMNEEKIIEAKRKESKESIFYIVVFFIGLLGFFTFEYLEGFFFFVSLISIVSGFIKCPNNDFIKILFWLFMICIILFTIYMIVLAFTCTNAIAQCNSYPW